MPADVPIILASSSPYRQELLKRLRLPFQCISPDIDETVLSGESPQNLVVRLAVNKAQAVQQNYPHALIIGSDQAATIEGKILGKPGTHARAKEQLRMVSGKKVSFYTGLCLLNGTNGRLHTCCEPFHVHFRRLDERKIEDYLSAEQPYNCAGSFKSEGLGIVLLDKLEGDDPNALIGLPLIQLINMLEKESYDVLARIHPDL